MAVECHISCQLNGIYNAIAQSASGSPFPAPFPSFTLIPSCAFLNASAIRSEKATVMRRWWAPQSLVVPWILSGRKQVIVPLADFTTTHKLVSTKFPPPSTGHSGRTSPALRLPPTLDGRVLAGDGTSVSTWRLMQRLKAYMAYALSLCV